jgi:hypothetical protein
MASFNSVSDAIYAAIKKEVYFLQTVEFEFLRKSRFLFGISVDQPIGFLLPDGSKTYDGLTNVFRIAKKVYITAPDKALYIFCSNFRHCRCSPMASLRQKATPRGRCFLPPTT